MGVGQGMVSNWATAEQHKGSAAVAHSNAKVQRAQGKAQRAQRYGQAQRRELENRVAGEQHADNVSRLRGKQGEAQGAVVAARGGSGFTADGSGSQAEVSVLRQFEQHAEDMAYSRSLQDQAARFEATMLRRSGDVALEGAEAGAAYTDAQGEMYSMMAKNANRAAIVSGVTEGIGAAIGAYFGGPLGAKLGAEIGGGVGDMYGSTAPGTYQSMNGGDSKKMQAAGQFAMEQVSSWLQ